MTQILFLEMGEEIFCRGIVPTIAAAGHGGANMILFHQGSMVDL
jgi:hypothetical protein